MYVFRTSHTECAFTKSAEILGTPECIVESPLLHSGKPSTKGEREFALRVEVRPIYLERSLILLILRPDSQHRLCHTDGILIVANNGTGGIVLPHCIEVARGSYKSPCRSTHEQTLFFCSPPSITSSCCQSHHHHHITRTHPGLGYAQIRMAGDGRDLLEGCFTTNITIHHILFSCSPGLLLGHDLVGILVLHPRNLLRNAPHGLPGLLLHPVRLHQCP